MKDVRRSEIEERREAGRTSLVLEIYWQGRHGRSRGTISDLSPSGCFVLSGDEISDGETVHVFVPIGDGMNAQFTGNVTNHEDDIGFAVRFHELGETQLKVLHGLINENADA